MKKQTIILLLLIFLFCACSGPYNDYIEINYAPEFNHDKITLKHFVYDTLGFKLYIMDYNKNDTEFSIEPINAPKGVFLDSTRTVRWIPQADQGGIHVFKIKVADLKGASNYLNVTMQVAEPWIPKPAEKLEHNGKGMRKIKSDGYSYFMNIHLNEKGKPNFAYTQVNYVSFSYDFWIDTTEVTRADFKNLLPDVHQDPGDHLPVITSWYNAARYCNARSRQDNLGLVYDTVTWKSDFSKRGYRLPTVIEWEYAYRGGARTRYYWDMKDDASKYCVFRKPHDAMLLPVAQKLPNRYGLYDMCGNMHEWCNDYFKRGSDEYCPDRICFDSQGKCDSTAATAVGGNYNSSLCEKSCMGTKPKSHLCSFRCVLPNTIPDEWKQ